jgi:hypothetical protein
MEEKKPRSGSVTKIKAILAENFMTHSDIKAAHPELTDGQISMAISHLKKAGKIEQEIKDRVKPFGRKQINTYRLKA